MANKDIKHNRNNVNRAEQTRRDNDNNKDLSIGLYDIDETIKYYFDEVLKLQITDSGGNINKVPVKYASPENWKSYQTNDLRRDSRGKIQLPILTFKRDSITKNRNLGNKVDANKPIYTFVDRGRDPNQRYDRLTMLNQRQTGAKYSRVLEKIVVPDYITVNYSCVVYTEFLTQMNTIIEAISYGEGGYWGDKSKYMVRAKVDEFPSAVELAIGEDRVVKSEFSLTIEGHIIPKTIQKQIQQGSSKVLTKTKIQLGESVVSDITKI
jgi:hypothetical protein|tara:strand:- start:176 stop:973 length:798 start_codon:yes stop_codon:yes gene_type:complete